MIRLISGSQAATAETVELTGNLQLGTDSTGQVYIFGSGSISGTPGTPGSGGLTWSEITSGQTGVVNEGYICNSASLITITLPSTFAVGDIIAVVGKGSGGWKLAQPTGDNIRVGRYVSTTGTSGYLQSTEQYDCVQLVGTVANTTWTVVYAVGNPYLN